MKKSLIAVFVIVALWAFGLATFAHGAAPAGCENEPSLSQRTDVLKCEPWESSTWWSNSGWWFDQGDTGDALDGRRFNRFPIDQSRMDNMTTSVVSDGCLVGSCLKVNMLGWQKKAGSYMAMSWIIPGQGGCSHSSLGCVPQQDIYMRYYMKFAPNFDPENYAFVDGSPQGGGGKFPGLGDATNGFQNNPSIQCGNGGEGPTLGIECWSARLNYNVGTFTSNGPQNAFLTARNYNASTRFGWYPYLYWNGATGGTRFSSAFWDNDDRGNSLAGACNTTYGFVGGTVNLPSCSTGPAGLLNNKWYLVEIHIKMNDVGQANGVMEAWLDGELRYQKTNVVFRNPGHNNLGIRQAWFDVYAGGVGVGMKEDTYVMFDELVVASSPIGPNTSQRRGSMVTVRQDPNSGMNGFSRGHYLSKVLPNYGGCYLSLFGLGSVTAGDNSVKCQNVAQTVSGVPGVWTDVFPSNNSNGIASPGKRDNFNSLYLPWRKELFMSGGSYISPGEQGGAEFIISGVLDFNGCASNFSVACANWKITSRWTTSNLANNWNAAFTNGLSADSGKWACHSPPCSALVKNAMFHNWFTDNAAACNDNIRVCMHGWGSNNNGRHFALTENIANTLCNPGTASGAEPLVHCELPANPKNIPVFTDINNCSDTPTGSGTTPGWRLQAMNVLVPGPSRSRAFYITGTFATNCSSGPAIVRDLWVFNAETGAWTQLASPPAMSYTPLMVYDSTRNQLLLQNDDKMYAYPLFGQNTWYDVTPTGGLGFATFNSYGAYAESGELFLVQDGNVTNGGGAGTTAVRAFSLNGAALISSPSIGFAAPSSQGAESTTTALIPVTLANHPGGTVTVDYAVTGGTATGGGVDYTLNSGTLSFGSGTSVQNISMTVVNDTAVEADETVQITLSNPSSGVALGNSVHVYTIVNDDKAAEQAPVTLFIGDKAVIGGNVVIGR